VVRWYSFRRAASGTIEARNALTNARREYPLLMDGAVLFRRFTLAISTLPTLDDWRLCALLLLVVAILVLPVGIRTGFLYPQWARFGPRRATAFLVLAFFLPCMVEETVFRVLLLPHPAENASAVTWWLWAVAGVILFVLYHPIKAPLVPSAERRAVYRNGTFLWMAGVVGTVCTMLYAVSGSLWPPMALHYAVVAAWVFCLGAAERLGLE
jgi:predicted Abi (CAAX) family protease